MIDLQAKALESFSPLWGGSRETPPFWHVTILNTSSLNSSDNVLIYSLAVILGFQFGLLGLVEEEWIATLSTIDPDDITFLDFVEEGRELAKELKEMVY